ncbi:hypothetical protein GCM10011490_25320 [Pseudoclavibacter endophyticus]|uniref:Dihydrofolate reductase n=1 Tax=Pseudoclavibacter endophyticus TaxID=1778590 RepID=A0A6H9WK98_9MICO|nr:dihydrofolate reductase family protein [Pseudoclavibacter endophyticus]KAB1647862.1 dihydrofolate reductase [Pseudoclavibacter endophyticus]GGA73403.1 hypothetical protein GCM10011490_25320 [Pseudoclavibacter endophyticus]
MTSFVYSTATTITGHIADQNHSLDWLFAVESTDVGIENRLDTSGALVMGRSTYEWLLAHEDVLDNPEKWLGFSGERPVFLFTTSEVKLPERSDIRVRRGDVAEVLPEIREAAGDADVWIVGGGDLAGQFSDAGALDEIELHLMPVALDGGQPVFPRRVESDRLSLIDARKAGQISWLRFAVDAPGRADA